MHFGGKTALFLATGGYVGRIRTAPGTFGSLLGLPLAWALSALPVPAAALLVAGFIVMAVPVAGAAERLMEKKDPGAIVIDEIAGILVTLLAVPFSGTSAALGFVLFRVFDILKPFPIRYLERRFEGGFGIVIDDVAAGIIAQIVLRILL